MGDTAIDATGQRFGMLTVLSRVHTQGTHHATWLCRCDCGALAQVKGYRLRNGWTKSCGCLRHGNATSHGMSYEPIYRAYARLINRHKSMVCREWKDSFDEFYKWSMANGYDDTKLLVVIDETKEPSPASCKWLSVNEAKAVAAWPRNTSGRTGVSYNKSTGAWMAQLQVEKKVVLKTRHSTFYDAVKAREEAEWKYGIDLVGAGE